MGFLSFLSFLICGGAILKEDFERSNMTQKNRQDAIKNNKPTYVDYNGNRQGVPVSRAVSTNEITNFYIDRDGNRKEVGIKTGRVYSSFNPRHEWIKKMNEEAKAKGKKYYYKEFPQFRDSDNRPKVLKCNMYNDRPYDISYRTYKSIKKPEAEYDMIYYDLNNPNGWLWPSKEMYSLTKEEAEPYL